MQTFSLPSTRLRSEKFLLIFELLYRHVYDSDNKDESLLKNQRMLSYHQIEFITKRITIIETSHRKNMTLLSTSLTKKTLLSKKQTKGTQLL